jgi:hypothetical protein
LNGTARTSPHQESTPGSAADERRERVDRCQSLVARPDATAAALLEVPEKAAHHIRDTSVTTNRSTTVRW